VSGHTPGPWKVYNHFDIYPEDDTEGMRHIAQVSPDGFENDACCITWEESNANARLIAQAPELKQQRDDLLAAARAVVERWDTPSWKDAVPTGEVIGHLRRAIAAAVNAEVEREEEDGR